MAKKITSAALRLFFILILSHFSAGEENKSPPFPRGMAAVFLAAAGPPPLPAGPFRASWAPDKKRPPKTETAPDKKRLPAQAGSLPFLGKTNLSG